MALTTISRAGWRDTWTVWKLMRACFERDAYDPVSILAMLVWPGDLTLKATLLTRTVGFIAGGQSCGQDQAWIIALGVHPDFRRRGVAARLLAECEAQLNKPRVRLTARVSNAAAINLYRRAGYVQIGLREGYYWDGESGIEMEKAREVRGESEGGRNETR